MDNNSWIAYVGPFQFPWGQPGSRRVFGVAAALANAGHKVIVGSGQWGDEGIFPAHEELDINYCNLGDLPSKNATVSEKLFQLLFESGSKTVAWLDAMPTPPKCVVVYGGGAAFMHRVFAWCQKKGVPIVADVVEWYDSRQMLGGFFGPFNISAKIAFHYYFPRCDGVIAISDFLVNHFQKTQGLIVVRVPPIIDISLFDVQPERFLTKNESINLVYAGTPGKKDLLGNIILGIIKADPSGLLFKLQILGPSAEEVKNILKCKDIPNFIEILGRIPQTAVAGKLQGADFSVLVRESKRFANAGFSTKFVESLINGTPVIANITSDLHKYLKDEVEGVICTDCSINAIADALNRVKNIPIAVRTDMRYNARQQALTSFNFKYYSATLSSFLEKILKN